MADLRFLKGMASIASLFNTSETRPRELAHQLLLLLCTSEEFGICYTARRTEAGEGSLRPVSTETENLAAATAASVAGNSAMRIINPTVLHFLLGLATVTQVVLLRGFFSC